MYTEHHLTGGQAEIAALEDAIILGLQAPLRTNL